MISKHDVLDIEPDDGGIEFKVEEFPWAREEGDQASTPSERILEGSPELQALLRILISEFKDIFSTELGIEPAKMDPIVLDIDWEKWRSLKNSLPPRKQTTAKEEEVRRQIDYMIRAGIIRISQAPYNSQVHLTPKPNGKWRFCIDFRAMNECCTSKGWHIPNMRGSYSDWDNTALSFTE